MVSNKNDGIQYNFLNDRPTTKDEIGTHSKIAESLLKIIHSNLKRPFVVGLFGPWGVGKSSIAQMLRENTEKINDGTKVIFVDAWRKHKETFLRQFVKKIARVLVSDESEREKIFRDLDFKRARHETFWKPDKEARTVFWLCMIAIVFGGVVLTAVSYYIDEFPTAIWIPIVTGIVFSTYYHFFLPKYSKHVTDYSENVTLHDVTHFRKVYFRDILAKSNNKTICIVIDNLDRIGTNDALAIMRMIKTFVVGAREDKEGKTGDEPVQEEALNKVVFIIPCDDGALREHVFKQNGEKNAKEFLRKFFNVILRIPSFNDRDCYRYACNLLNMTNLKLDEAAKDRIADIIKSLLGNNPRQPKIFINNFLARYVVAETFEKDGKLPEGIVTEHPEWFAVYVALDTEFSDLEMPKTADGIRALLRGDSQGKNEHEQSIRKSRVAFLQKVSFTVERITAKAWAAYYYLKKANDALLIDGFEELEEAAQKGTDDFVDKLETIRGKHPNVVELLWNVSPGGVAQIKIMQSILKAKAEITKLVLQGRVPEEMASLIRDKVDDLPMLPSDVVYQEILRPREDILYSILYGIVAVDSEGSKPELYRDGGPKEFQVELVREILIDDSNLSVEVLERLGRAVDYLGERSDSLTIPAIKNGKYPSTNIMGKGITLFREGSDYLYPLDLVTFCGSFEGDKCIKQLNKIVDILNQNLTGNKYTTKELCEAAMNVKKIIDIEDTKGMNVSQINVVNTIKALDTRYVSDSDWKSRYAILKTFKEYSEFAKFTQWQNVSKDILINRGNSFLKSGEENVVSVFLKKEKEMVKSLFNGVLPETARRSEKLCHIVLDFYPDSNQVVINTVFPNEPEWILVWLEKKSISLKKRREISASVQSALLSLAPQMNYKIKIYKALSLLDVSKSPNAQRNRENHFSTLLGAQQPLSVPENLEFVLERFLMSKYSGNKEHQSKLDDAFGKIDQDIVGSELKKLIRDYKKLKKVK